MIEDMQDPRYAIGAFAGGVAGRALKGAQFFGVPALDWAIRQLAAQGIGKGATMGLKKMDDVSKERNLPATESKR